MGRFSGISEHPTQADLGATRFPSRLRSAVRLFSAFSQVIHSSQRVPYLLRLPQSAWEQLENSPRYQLLLLRDFSFKGPWLALAPEFFGRLAVGGMFPAGRNAGTGGDWLPAVSCGKALALTTHADLGAFFFANEQQEIKQERGGKRSFQEKSSSCQYWAGLQSKHRISSARCNLCSSGGWK